MNTILPGIFVAFSLMIGLSLTAYAEDKTFNIYFKNYANPGLKSDVVLKIEVQAGSRLKIINGEIPQTGEKAILAAEGTWTKGKSEKYYLTASFTGADKKMHAIHLRPYLITAQGNRAPTVGPNMTKVGNEIYVVAAPLPKNPGQDLTVHFYREQ